MKKMVKLVSATLLALFIFTGFAMGQNESTLIKMNRSIKLNGDSEKEEVKVEVNEKTKLLIFSKHSEILCLSGQDANGCSGALSVLLFSVWVFWLPTW